MVVLWEDHLLSPEANQRILEAGQRLFLQGGLHIGRCLAISSSVSELCLPRLARCTCAGFSQQGSRMARTAAQ